MKNKIVRVIVAFAGIVVIVWSVAYVQRKQHESREICRVFRELNHARTIVYLDEIDVEDCPRDFRDAYATYVIEVRAAGAYKSSKHLALEKLQDIARLHGVTFTPRS